MKIYAPDYYPDFRCSADKCKHNCCIGWEIDIDSETYKKYKRIDGDFGKKLNENITISEDHTPCFRLTENERCPFLLNNNLCEIIIKRGEDDLCQICVDHPRFRNFIGNRTEVGVGLCCESAADLILNREVPTKLIEISDQYEDDYLSDEEAVFLNIRSVVFDIIQDRAKSFEKRVCELCDTTGILIPKLSPAEWAQTLLTLEQLDEKWTEFLTAIADETKSTTKCVINDYQAEQLLFYFTYRHMSCENISGSLRFALMCTEILRAFAPYAESVADLCRMFSAEIEYSEENTEFLMNF